MNISHALVALALTLPTWAQDAPTIEKLLDKYQVPGASVAVIREGKVTLLQGFGVRELGTHNAVGPDTIFQLASVTKSWTSTALGRLVDQGKLDWEVPVVHYFPEMRLAEPFATAHVTLRDFLSHRSGLPPFTGDLVDELGAPREQVMEHLEELPLSQGFRQKPGYSNVGITVAGMAGARVAGQSYEELVRKTVFEPLQMTRSGFLAGPPKSTEDITFPHGLDHGKVRVFAHMDQSLVLAPAGAGTSSARDMSRWILALLGPEDFLKPATLDSIFQPVIAEHIGFSEAPPITDQSGFYYALGWNVYYYNGHKILEKGGARFGVRSLVTLIPDQKAAIVTLSNLNLSEFPEAVRASFLEEALGKTSGDVQAAIWAKQQEVANLFAGIGAPLPSPKGPLSMPLSSYVGTYHHPFYGDFRIVMEGSKLAWRAGRLNFGGQMVPVQYNRFLGEFPAGHVVFPLEMTFVVDENGRAIRLITDAYGELTRVERTAGNGSFSR